MGVRWTQENSGRLGGDLSELIPFKGKFLNRIRFSRQIFYILKRCLKFGKIFLLRGPGYYIITNKYMRELKGIVNSSEGRCCDIMKYLKDINFIMEFLN